MKAYGYDWHQVMIGRIEAAQRPLRLNEAVDLAKLFGVPLERLTWSNPDLNPEEIDARIADIEARLQKLLQQWPRTDLEVHKARQQLEAAEKQRQQVMTARSDLTAELAALRKFRESPT